MMLSISSTLLIEVVMMIVFVSAYIAAHILSPVNMVKDDPLKNIAPAISTNHRPGFFRPSSSIRYPAGTAPASYGDDRSRAGKL